MLLARGSCRPYSAAASRADKDLEPTAQEASAIEGLPIVGKTSCRRAGPGCETRPPVSRGRHDIAIVAPPFRRIRHSRPVRQTSGSLLL